MELDDPLSTSGNHSTNSKNLMNSGSTFFVRGCQLMQIKSKTFKNIFFSWSDPSCSNFGLSNDSKQYWCYAHIIFTASFASKEVLMRMLRWPEGAG